MNKMLLALSVVALVGAAAPVSADAPCETSEDAIDTTLGFYVMIDTEQGGIWVYEESNGKPGLQRAADDNGNCADGGADTIIL